MGRLVAAEAEPSSDLPPEEARTQSLEAMLLSLQAGRVAFESAVMQLRYAPAAKPRRMYRHIVIAFLRLQRLTDVAERLVAEAGGPQA